MAKKSCAVQINQNGTVLHLNLLTLISNQEVGSLDEFALLQHPAENER